MKFSVISAILIANTLACSAIEWKPEGNCDCVANCDFNGNALLNVLMSNAEDCASTCHTTYKCSHWTWSRQRGGTCFLKQGSVGKSDALYRKGFTCGIVRYRKEVDQEEYDGWGKDRESRPRERDGMGWAILNVLGVLAGFMGALLTCFLCD